MRKYLLLLNLYRYGKLSCLAFLFLSWSVSGQQNQVKYLHEQFTRYQGNALQEKLFIHTSKDVFLAGETMFFKLYAVDGMFHQPLDLSRVAYVELINSKNQPLTQLKVALENNGKGSGSLIVPDSVVSGRYRVIGYTSWMRNFNADFFYTKDITVINPLRSSPVKGEGQRTNVVAKFFPEGGNLVYGLESKVGFQVTTASGNGIDAFGAVITESNDTIVKFQTLKFGLGSFSFVPKKGERYKAFVKTKESSVLTELPPPFDAGYVMSVNEDTSGELKVRIQSNIESKGEIYLFVHSRQRVQRILSVFPDGSGSAVINIAAQDIEDGISHITLFDPQLKPVAERLYFKQPERILDIKVGPLKNSFGKRESVNLSIETREQDKLNAANLSLSIFRIDGVQQYDSADIVNFLLLTSDLKGTVENPAYYMRSGAETKRATDNLMLTHGWRRFSWEDVMKNNWPVVQFSPDTEGMGVRALVTDTQNNPKTNTNLILSTQSNGIRFFPARTNARGIAQFYSRDLFGQREIIFQQIADSSKFNISLISPYTNTYPSHTFPTFETLKDDMELIRSYSIHKQVQRGFYPLKELVTKIDSVPFYGAPDKSYLLADYVLFPQMLDVFREYVFEIIVRKSEKKYHIFLQDKDTQTFFENEPFVLLDGVPVFNSDRIATLPAQNIKKMDVVNREFLYGPFVFNGIIVLTTYDTAKYSGVQLNPEAVVFDFEGLQQRQEFYSPAYNEALTREDRLPDFRNVLLWSPDIETNTTGKSTVSFSTSDLPGKYIGVINGLSTKGLPGSCTFTFNVE